METEKTAAITTASVKPIEITTIPITTIVTTTTAKTEITEATTIITTELISETTKPPITTAARSNKPKNGAISGNMIYFDGVGWIVNEGGGGEGIYDSEMYMNGNKIGCFG